LAAGIIPKEEYRSRLGEKEEKEENKAKSKGKKFDPSPLLPRVLEE
jgi:hypothetical protein